MGIVVHHTPANGGATWSMYVSQPAWDGNKTQDGPGTPIGATVDFELPDVPDPRKLQFKFHWTMPITQLNGWEPDDFIRRVYLVAPPEVWTFEASPRVIYENPCPPAVVFNARDVLAFQVITQSAFRAASSMFGTHTTHRIGRRSSTSGHVTTPRECRHLRSCYCPG
jgi:hypothetical protein